MGPEYSAHAMPVVWHTRASPPKTTVAAAIPLGGLDVHDVRDRDGQMGKESTLVLAGQRVRPPSREVRAHQIAAPGARLREIALSVDALTRELGDEPQAPLRIGMGHAGPAVVGSMGHGVARYLTAVGDTVHGASRLQDLTKRYARHLVISSTVTDHADLDVSALPRHELGVRNRAAPVATYVIKDARGLAELATAGPGAAG